VKATESPHLDATPATGGSGQSTPAVLDAASDPVADRWTIGLWAETTEQFRCRYFYHEEGAYDAVGRWRRKRIVHCIVGRPANQVAAAAMASHLCYLTRQAAAAYAASRSAVSNIRRSFAGACAERLILRLRACAAANDDEVSALEQRENDALLKERGVSASSRQGSYDRSGRDRSAARAGRAAAENFSLVLRLPPAKQSHGHGENAQLTMPF
jgi:hypothetical protein